MSMIRTLSALLPVMEPKADWTAPEAESIYDWRVEVCFRRVRKDIDVAK